MHRLRIILYVLAGLYLLLSVLGMLNEDWVMNQFSLLNLITYFKVWLSVGLILLAGIILLDSSALATYRRQTRHAQAEVERMKAHVYDLEKAHRQELARLQAEDEENERKLEAFRRSLPESNNPQEPEA
jgi:hypothetical protein